MRRCPPPSTTGDSDSDTAKVKTGPRKAVVARIVAIALFVVMLALWRPAITHARAAGALLRASSEAADVGLRDFGAVPTSRESLTLDLDGIEGPGLPLRAHDRPQRLRNGPRARCALSRRMDEPRLVRLAESIAATGITVREDRP